MTIIGRDSVVHVDVNTLVKSTQIAGELLAGEALLTASACFIAITDGLVYMAGSASTNIPTIHGYTPRDAAIGQPVTLYQSIRARYANPTTAMTPGAEVFQGAPGVLDDATAAGLAEAIGFAIDAKDVFLSATVINDQTAVS